MRRRTPSGYYSDDEPLSSSPSSYSSCDSIDEVFERYRQYRRRVRGLVQSLSDLDDSMVINQGTNASRQPQLAFHSIHGANVERKSSNRIARRKESFCKGLAFSNRPIAIDETVCLRLSEVATNWSGVLRFGVTNVDPETYRNAPVPKFACPDLTSKSGYWAKALPERFSTQGNILHFHVTAAGELIYGINGQQKGIFLCGINTGLPLWIIVDIYGNSVAVEFVDSSEFRTTDRSRSHSSSQPRVSSGGISNPSHVVETPPAANTSAGQLTPAASNRNLDQIRFHPFHGRHINLHNDRTVATRMMQEYTQGYVFTERPVNINEKVVVQVLEVQQLFNGGLAFGVTCCDPSSLRSVDLPDNSGDLVEMPQYWVGIQDIALQPGKNTVLSFWITETAEVKMRKDAGNPHTVLHVDTSVPLYMWFDCYGTTQSIKIVGSSRSQSPMRASPAITASQPARVSLPSIPAMTTRAASREAPSPKRENSIPATLRVDMRTRPSIESTTSSVSRLTVDDLLGTNLTSSTSAPSLPARDPPPPPVAPRTVRGLIPAPPSRPPPPVPSTPSYTMSPPPTAAPVLTPPVLNFPPNLDDLLRSSTRENMANASVASSSPKSSPAPPARKAPDTPTPAPRVIAASAAPSKDELEEIDPAEECTVCMSAKIDSVIYTCGHMCMCYNCAKQTFETQGHCPLCRKSIQDVIKCYRS